MPNDNRQREAELRRLLQELTGRRVLLAMDIEEAEDELQDLRDRLHGVTLQLDELKAELNELSELSKPNDPNPEN